MTTLAKAGLDVEEAMAGARGALQLATAAQIDNAAAAELVANAVNTFQLAGTEATRVADLLTGASIEAQGSISDMGIALRQSASAAAGIGLSIEDTVTLITALAQAGLQGSDAGTTLRVALLNLAAPTKAAREELERLNITVRDTTTGAVRADVFLQVEEALRGVGAAQADASRRIIFGQNAFRVSTLLGRQTADSMRDLRAAVTETGLAVEVAGAQTAGFAGDVENLRNQASALGTSIGQLVIPPLSAMIRVFADSAGAAANLAAGFQDLIEEARGLGGAFGDFVPFADEAGGFLEGFGGTVLKTAARAQLMGPALTIASLAMDKFGDSSKDAASDLEVLIVQSERAQEAIDGLARRAGGATDGGAAQGLSEEQILNRITAFDDQQMRAKIRGDSLALLQALEAERAFLLQQLDRQVVRGDPELRRQVERALLGATNELETISTQASNTKKQAASEIARQQSEADQALLDALSQRRDLFEQTKGVQAENTAQLQDDIRFQNNLQRLLKIQIAKIQDQVEDEKLRKQAIDQLRLALIASNNAEKALRQEQARNASARRDQIQELEIQIAEETGNDARLERAIRRRIATLKKQIDAAKGDAVLVKQLQLQIARLNNQLKDLKDEEEETGKTARQRAAEFFFEQLQAQQGFAANLLGNIIPTSATSGLVGVPSPDIAVTGGTGVGAGLAAAAALQAGKEQGGPTAGQANTTNAILQRILRAVQDLNRNADTPEAVQNKRAGSAVMDGIGGGGGGTSLVM
jgi:TP901 family phage tail tape measure protein